MPHFHDYATFYGKIQVKNISSRMQISGMEKSILKSVSLISNCIFLRKKIFFGKIFVIFEFFSNSKALLQNLGLVYDFSIFFGLFDTYIDPWSAFVLKWEI